MRLASLNVCMQGIALAMKLDALNEKGTIANQLYVAGALMSTASAASDLVNVFLETQRGGVFTSTDASKATTLESGRIRLIGSNKFWGQGIGAVGGCVTLAGDIINDGGSIVNKLREGEFALASTYTLKLLGSSLLALGALDLAVYVYGFHI